MRVLSLLIYLSTGVVFTATYLPLVELRRSRGRGKQVSQPDSDKNTHEKRTREIIRESDIDRAPVRTGDNTRTRHTNEEEGNHGAQTNSGSGKRLRGSKRQRKKEKKKNKSKDKEVPKASGRTRGKSTERIPSEQKDEGQGLLSKVYDVLPNLVLDDERTDSYRSDKLQCSDRLNRKLVKFYEEEVRIHQRDMETARSIVNEFVQQIWPHISANTAGLNFSGYRLVGSMAEDLAAVEHSDFDFHLPLEIRSENLKAQVIAGLPGYKHIICDDCEEFVEISKNQPHLSPSLIVSKLQSLVQKAVDHDRVSLIGDCYQYRPGYKGPTVTVEIDCNGNDGEETFRIEFVPLVTTTDGQRFVAKKAKFGLQVNEPLSWRQSFCEQERDFIRHQSSDDLSLLRLVKAIFHHKERSLNYVSSYLLKNTYCHLHSSGYDWSSKTLCDQLQDFLDVLLTFSKQQNLPCWFEDSINLFSSFHSADTIKNLENRLKKILDKFEEMVKKWMGEPELKDEL